MVDENTDRSPGLKFLFTNSQLTDAVILSPWNLLMVRMGRACRDDARGATLDQIRRTLLPVQVVVHRV
ncbi:hypothetical protein BFW88_06380 [Pseudomonas fluorescens]|nr:hypothetical protein BFW88_06380 [Pseudomonas fluorescens]OPB12704.1 hypothetical protein BFW92_06355 [Pseudomonas fluorescens]OPB25104.1 hypothetical protein BFW93_06375 [Pseudomonas fluorescens]